MVPPREPRDRIVIRALGFSAINHRLNVLGFANLSEFSTDFAASGDTGMMDIVHALNWVRTNGYARDNEELELGVRCIAAGIYDDSRRLVAGLSLSAPADRLQDSWLQNLKETALQISRGMGYATDVAA